MKFWDSSAICPLIVEEKTSRACRDLQRSDPSMLVWAFTATEVTSALCRRFESGGLDAHGLEAAERRLDLLSSRWHEVQPTDAERLAAVRDGARRLMHAHRIRSGDALQLAAALVVFGSPPRRRDFVTLDDALAQAAAKEGFNVLKPGSGRAPGRA